MASKANYIIFHPDYARDQVKVTGEAVVGNRLQKKWVGDIWVDAIGNGNEDPYVFNNGWIYSYCHASQLRRNISTNYLQKDSWLIFCSGDSANDGVLCVDTVFQIELVHEWIQTPHLAPPLGFKGVRKNKPDLWNRHLKFPFQGQHSSVSHSYEAALGTNKSFLPLKGNCRVSLDFELIPLAIRNKIIRNVRGKYPVNLTESEASALVTLIRKRCDTQVLRIINLPINNISGQGTTC
jgi:hypothetical protein